MRTTLSPGNHVFAPHRWHVKSLLFGLMVAACGGAPQPANSGDAQAEAAPAAGADETAEPEASETSEASAEPEANSDAAAPEAAADEAAAPEADKNEPREVVYKMTPGGLEIEVDGVKFSPKASAVKVQGGAWGVKIAMDAEGVGDDPRHLLKPKGGVLAFGGSVKRKDKTTKFGDRREGEETAEIAAGASISFESTWPKDGRNALWAGDEVLLDVGLWGIGATKDSLRPVRQFFSLRMVGGNKPQPVIQPPASAE